MDEERRAKKGLFTVLDTDLIADLRDEEVHCTIDKIENHPYQGAPAEGIRPNDFIQMLSSSERTRMDLDLSEVFDISLAMSRKTDRTPPIGLSNGNLTLARTILEAIKVKESAGLARNPFTGRACYKLTDREAAFQAMPDENTAQLAALILETGESAFIDWAHRIQDEHQAKVSKDVTEKIKPSSGKPKRLEGDRQS
jgi:hypothetical protein